MSSDHPGGGSSVLPARAPEPESRSAAFRRYLKLTLLGALLPGSAFVATGRRRTGAVILILTGLVVVGAIVAVVVIGRDRLLQLAVRPQTLGVVGVAAIVAAVVWVLIQIASQRVLEPRNLSFGQRAVGTALVVVLCSVVAAPLAIGSQYAFTTRQVVTSLFDSGSLAEANPRSPSAPVYTNPTDPWAEKKRLNVLLLGSDWSMARAGTGVRTDTMIVASIETATGQTTLFSLPRNLQRVPFPKGKFRNAYPNGFTNPAQPNAYLLNAIYNVVPAEHPELFSKAVARPGVEALKLAIGETLGLKIDYYLMANLGGFRQVVDALGGVYVNVRYDIPINSKEIAPGVCSKPEGYVRKGENQLLDGNEALWFARARCGGGQLADADNDRMRRQRCVIGAIARRADPATLATRYQAIVTQARRILNTDIPLDLLGDLVTLGERVSQHEIRSLPFTGTTLRGTNANPDFAAIRAAVRKALAAPAAPKPSTGSTPKPAASPSASTSPTYKKGEDSVTAQPLTAVC